MNITWTSTSVLHFFSSAMLSMLDHLATSRQGLHTVSYFLCHHNATPLAKNKYEDSNKMNQMHTVGSL
jgi:hypothetical protein